MPTYEYKCANGHLFERTFSRIISQRHAKCPVCGKRAERQISGGTGIVFKGSGFYHTDYKTKQQAPEKAEKTEKMEKSDKAASAPAAAKKKDSSSDK
ncbi:MAG TPA: zinc ribbon domain-containing protein [Gemmatimonadales bacterium]|nr:zinc ribbon domain-containing protein [Gemmatimonadales bacterium]